MLEPHPHGGVPGIPTCVNIAAYPYTAAGMTVRHAGERVDRPNIVWVSVEDINPLLGCYGNSYATTPHLDGFALQGIRYANAHSMAPVCSASRAAIITGMAACSLGTHHHRSAVTTPDFLRLLPAYLRDAGYFTSNCVKTDYNLAGTFRPDHGAPITRDAWSEWHGAAHWRQRREGQPFFSVFNYTECHSFVTREADDVLLQERLNLLQSEDFHDPAAVPLPPYHPDYPEIRRVWARYYDAITQIDHHVGRHLRELQEDGVEDDTIVVFWADHGTGMLRAKHWLWEQGDHVPLIVRYPARWQHLAPELPGTVVEEPVTTLDLAASTLVMAGLPVPAHMQSQPVLCHPQGVVSTRTTAHRPYVVSGRDRLDTRFELVRAVRGRHLRYQRNFFPHLPYFRYENSLYGSEYIRVWDRLARSGQLRGAQRQIAARRKPSEELYDGATDPWFVTDLAREERHQQSLTEMREQLYGWMIEHRDLGLIDEPELHERADGAPLWEVGRQLDNYERILETADLSRRGNNSHGAMLQRAGDDDSAIRFWAVTGLAIGQFDDQPTVATLNRALADSAVSVRIAAADALCRLGCYEAALPALIDALEHPLVMARGRAANVLDSQPRAAAPSLCPALVPLRQAIARLGDGLLEVQYRFPMERSVAAIEGSTDYYRWPD